jgi:hypothetical protein
MGVNATAGQGADRCKSRIMNNFARRVSVRYSDELACGDPNYGLLEGEFRP